MAEINITNNVPNTTATYTASGRDVTLSVKTDDGYLFDGVPSVEYDNWDGDFVILNLSVNGAGVLATLVCPDVDDAITIKGNTKADSQITIQNNVPNTAVTYEKSGDNYILTIVADTDYKFSGAPQFQFDDLNGDYLTVNGVLSVNDTITTVTLNDVDSSSPITITGETVSTAVPEIALINNIPDTAAEVVYDGVTAIFTVTGTYPKHIFINPIVNYTNKAGEQVSLPMTINEQTCMATVTDIDDSKQATLSGLYEQVCLITNNLTLCQPIEPLPSYIRSGETLTVTIQANDGTEFNIDDNAPSIEYENESGDLIKLLFTISENKNTANITVLADSVNFSGGLTLSGGAVPKQVIGSNYGAINVYKVTLDEIERFAKVRFFKETSADGSTFENIDLGKWVNRIKRIYTDVPESSKDVIKCGNYDTGIEVKQPDVSKITLDFGSVIVPAHNKNTLDYDSEVNVFLPFMGFVQIPTDYVGKSISLVYDINIVTGDGVAKFTYDDIPFQVEKISPSSNVIYLTSYEEGVSVIGSDTWDELLYYGLEPFIYLKWFDDLNNGRNNDSKTGYIKSFKGFNIFSDVSPISSTEMTVEEQQTIIRLLESGVYIE